MRAVLELAPSINYSMVGTAEQADAMQSFGRRLMGLAHGIALIGQARAVTAQPDWPNPPKLERRWYAVVRADDETTLEMRTRTLRTSLESVGMRCAVAIEDQGKGTAYPDNPVDHARSIFPSRLLLLSPEGVGLREEVATLVLRRWPREVAPGWLGQALAGDLPIDVGIHIEPEDPQSYARFLKQQVAVHSQQDSARPDAGSVLGVNDAERMREKMIAGTDRPCRVAVAFTVRGRDKAELKKNVETLKYTLGLTLADVQPATFEHDRGLQATSLDGECHLEGAWRTLDCTAVASTWPFQPATVNHKNGAPIGTTNGMLVKLDPFDLSLESFGGIVLAKVGMGKSYFLKLLARRLKGVEVIIVEQRIPAEYDGLAGAISCNLAATPLGERSGRLRDFVSRLWDTAKSDPRPRLLILDELWSLLRDPALAALVEEIARIGRHHYLALWVATQQVEEMLESEGGRAVINNAAVRVLLKQHDHDLDKLCKAIGLDSPARRYLRGAARGQALLDVGGMLVPVDIQASPLEHSRITTDPREKVAA